MSVTTNPVYKVDANGNVVGTEEYGQNGTYDNAPPVYASQVNIVVDDNSFNQHHGGSGTQVVQAVPAGTIPPLGQHVISVSSGAVDPVYNLTEQEVILLAYQTPVKYLAIIDLVFSLIFLGTGNESWVLSMISVFGPIFGIWGASGLIRNPSIVYLLFCIYGCIVDVYLLAVYPNFWTFLSFFVQLYITKIVSSFTKSLGNISEERLKQMRRPDFVSRATYGGRQVRAYYY